MSVSIQDLKALGKQGFIPGPEESEECFLQRVSVAQHFAKEPQNFLQDKRLEPFNVDTLDQLGAYPDWVQQTYSNKKLLPWQAAATWIFESADNVKLSVIQLRNRFRSGSFLGYYRDEILVHEAIHAMRVAFEEPRFEEILAYYYSPKKWRRALGALFRTPNQALFFMGLIVSSLLIQVIAVVWLPFQLFSHLQLVIWLPLIDLVLRGAVLIKDRRLLRKALKKLCKLFPKQHHPFVIALRLKDAEIQKIALASVEDLLIYIKDKSTTSIRWQQILAQFS